nr:hypothetical protein [Sediminibacter sp. Hel_I_10]
MVFISKLALPKGYVGLTIFPFIILKYEHLKTDAVLMNHERIHLKQQLELLILPFFIWYFLEFIVRLVQFRKWNTAYRNISFEREAYKNEQNLKYLPSRSLLSFLKYL